MLNTLTRIKNTLLSEVTTVPPVLQGVHFKSLDGIRGIAILIVILAHFGINQVFKPYHPLIYGSIGVHIFFVLSGFLITTLLIKEKLNTGEISLKRFYTRRILKIVPAMYLFLLVLIALKTFYGLKIPGVDFAYSLLFLKNLPIRNIPLTAHLWTLAVEMQFYLVFPFLLSLSINKYLIITSSIIIAVFGVSIISLYCPARLNSNSFIHFVTKAMLYSFWKGPVIILIGSVSSVLTFKGVIKIEIMKRSYFFSFVLFVVAIIIQSEGFIFYTKYISEFLSACAVAYVILLNINAVNFLSVILKNVILVRIGIISYGLYVWQELFLGNHVWQPWLKGWTGLPFFIVLTLKLLCVLVIAHLSYYFFESRFLKFKDRFK
jgi:peptidoglycan/LPS O-acetylase OafA/YrhL